MAAFKVLCVLLFVLSVPALARFVDELPEERDIEDDGLNKRRLRMPSRCNKQGGGCSTFGAGCCGTLQCYWKEGYSAIQSGVCVACIQRNQLCQSDSQCCSGLVCHKEKLGYLNGGCDLPRSAGQPCHEDVQCASKNCRISFWDQLLRNDDVCA